MFHADSHDNEAYYRDIKCIGQFSNYSTSLTLTKPKYSGKIYIIKKVRPSHNTTFPRSKQCVWF